MKKKRHSPTKELWDALEVELSRDEEERSSFPKGFLIGLRLALESGLTCQQITSMIILQTSLFDMSKSFDRESLISRARYLAEVIKEDIRQCESGLMMRLRTSDH